MSLSQVAPLDVLKQRDWSRRAGRSARRIAFEVLEYRRLLASSIDNRVLTTAPRVTT